MNPHLPETPNRRRIALRAVPAVTAAFAIALVAAPIAAETIGWRTDGDGRYPGTTPPLAWSPDTNVRFKTAMPATSNATPVLLADRSLVIVTSEPNEVLALHADTGEIVWRGSTDDVTEKPGNTHRANGRATTTPVTDGARVFADFGSGVVAAWDLEGNRLWAREVQRPSHRWGHSASPTLAGGHLVVHFVDVIALDPGTGEEVWRAASQPRWGSLTRTTIAGTDVVVTPNGDVFRASDGKAIATEIGKVTYATPVVEDGVIYFIQKRATAVKIPDSLDGAFETLWEARLEGSRHYASPVIEGGRVYAVSREQKFSILDAVTGKLLHASTLDLDKGANSAYPSLAVAGGKVFVSAENGTTAVLEPGDDYEELKRNSVEGFRSSPVFHDDRLYLRTFDHLYCFTEGQP